MKTSFVSFVIFFIASTTWAASLTPEEITLQQSLFVRAYNNYLAKIRVSPKGNPSPTPMNLGKKSYSPPAFPANSKREDWLPLFAEWTENQVHQEIPSTDPSAKDIPNLETLKKLSMDKFASYYQNQPFAHFSAVEPIDEKVIPSAATAKAVQINESLLLPLPQNWPSDHTLDLSAYVAERFPQPLQTFLQETRAQLVMDNSSCEASLAVQQREGFRHAVKFMGDSDSPESQFTIVSDDHSPAQYRFVVCQIRGNDDLTRMVDMIGPLFAQPQAKMLYHSFPQPLFVFNQTGQSLKVDPKNDLVVIGFQNSIWWKVSDQATNKNWRRDMLTSAGVEFDIFSNIKTGRRILSVENIYGDEMLQTMQTLWSMGARRFIYAGTAGGVDVKLHIGDVMLPTDFQALDKSWFHFDNGALQRDLSLGASGKIYPGSHHGWASTLIQETIPVIQGMADEGVQSLDVEAKYFAEFLRDRPAEKLIIIAISDVPLSPDKSQHFDNATANRNLPMQSAEAIVFQLLEKDLDPQFAP